MMHNTAFEALGLDYAYLAFDFQPDRLEDAVKGLKALGAKGWNVSMPYKTDIIPLLDEISEVSRLCESVNTVINRDGKLYGTVTDGTGYMSALADQGFDIRGKKMTVLGCGGAATAICIQAALDGATAAVYVQSPNYYGVLEDMDAIVAATHAAGAKVIMGVNPISLGLLKTPGEYGVDIAVGEGQPLGMPLSFGGPYLGFMTCKKAMMRKLPGRIVGETKDDDGNRCFVLTLQAREQHIRREKASSNICSNEALCAMTASIYLAAMGPKGLRQAAESSAAHAHYLAGELAKLGFGLRSGDKPFFHEFLTDSPIEPETLCAKLEEQGILGGLPVDGGILWCCTECNSKAEIDRLIKVIGEVLA